MIDPDQLPPTRAVLLDLRRELDQAVQGHAILERKRETLLRELWDLFSEVKHTEREVRERFALAYQVQREARLVMGMDAMRFAGLAPAAETEYAVEVRSVMGVSLPLVTMRVEPLPFPYSPAGIAAVFDELRTRWIEVGRILGSWTEISGSVWRVAAELEQTQRRVNALENLLIPKYQSAIQRIQVILDEQERESFMRTKRVKEQRGR
ncbi:MAG: V-type ATP synthase subunit D [Bryobacteraceae bacterium]|jgi:V/A-type H+-transporting ATPase subunit D